MLHFFYLIKFSFKRVTSLYGKDKLEFGQIHFIYKKKTRKKLHLFRNLLNFSSFILKRRYNYSYWMNLNYFYPSYLFYCRSNVILIFVYISIVKPIFIVN